MITLEVLTHGKWVKTGAYIWRSFTGRRQTEAGY